MNISVRSLFICSLITTAVYATEPEILAPDDQEQDIALLENDHELFPFNLQSEEIQFARKHAEEIAAELLYLIDHTNPAANEALYQAAMALMETLEKDCQTFSTQEKPASYIEINKYGTAMALHCLHMVQTYLQQTLTPDTCPLLQQARAYLPRVETMYKEAEAQGEKLYAEFPHDKEYEAMFSAMQQEKLKSLAICKPLVKVAYDYMHTQEHVELLKKLVHAWAAFMKEDAFFEALHKKTVPSPLPATLDTMMRAAEAYGKSFHAAVFPDSASHNMFLSEEDFDEEAECDICDDATEIDFSEQFKKRHAK